MPNSVCVVMTPATSSVVGKRFSGTDPQTSDTFKPQLGRNMYLTLSGTWEGEIRLTRSVDGGITWNRITVDGGKPTLIFKSNCDEVVQYPTDQGGTYRLEGLLTAGEAIARLAQ